MGAWHKIDWTKHERGNVDCSGCYSKRACKKCGGIMHSEIYREDADLHHGTAVAHNTYVSGQCEGCPEEEALWIHRDYWSPSPEILVRLNALPDFWDASAQDAAKP